MRAYSFVRVPFVKDKVPLNKERGFIILIQMGKKLLFGAPEYKMPIKIGTGWDIPFIGLQNCFLSNI